MHETGQPTAVDLQVCTDTGERLRSRIEEIHRIAARHGRQVRDWGSFEDFQATGGGPAYIAVTFRPPEPEVQDPGVIVFAPPSQGPVMFLFPRALLTAADEDVDAWFADQAAQAALAQAEEDRQKHAVWRGNRLVRYMQLRPMFGDNLDG